MTSCRPRYIGTLALHAFCSLAALNSSALGQQPAGGRDLIRAPREGLVEFEEVVIDDHRARSPEDNLAWQFNILVFRNGDAAAAARKLEARLISRINEIDRDCKLTDGQKKKLGVAGQGDMKRAFARLDEFKERFSVAAADPVKQRQLLEEVTRFRPAVTTLDCFGDGSLFAKVLKNTLTPQQWAMRQRAVQDASNVRHRSTIRWAVGSLDIWLQLGAEQREKLESLLTARTRAPRKFGEYDYYGLIFQVSRLPKSEVKPIFDAGQWEKVQRQFAEAQRLERILKGGGFLPEEDVADTGKARPEDPISEPERPRS